jgi:hypothetical protein
MVAKMKYPKKQMIDQALAVFQAIAGLTVDFEIHENHREGYPDALMRVAYMDRELFFAVAVKPRLTRAVVGLAAQELMKYNEKGLLVTRYVTPQIADLLKEMDIPFIDTAGNAYINQLPLYVFIKGNKLVEEPKLEPLQRAFRPAGLMTLFTLLCNPGMEKEPLRNIAKAADVALGTVNRVMKEIAKMGYLVDLGKGGRRLVRKDNLLKRWITAYPEKLRPKLIKGRYKTIEKHWWEDIDIRDFDAYWGGEVAAGYLTDYLRPDTITIYTKHPIGKLVLKNKLKKDPEGNVEVLNAFWNFEHNYLYTNLVHPILVFADLMATGDTRNIEVAGMIYDAEIDRFIRED